ncbi:hypothetical protein N7508_006041 [Penicillium antarcticum]|uniref:uncharacterized protein n=1 Tax=Penicillium antarcticum TaxID=416450 RepID=UPI00238430E5|nr:uncharacterized protein N7508_006041 [Penicillium antarcticum]KAJ5307026.1 hypothetical protein N7508_006041 [Penicillium antarcticum]
MASDQYAEICDQLYTQIMRRLENCYKDGTRVGRFAPIGTAQEVLKPEILYMFFRSLQLPQIETYDLNLELNTLVRRVGQRKLHTFLAILIFTSCTIEAARTFTVKLLAPTDTNSLPAKREPLVSIFVDPVTPDKILSAQACFFPVVICSKDQDRIESLERECLPYLEQELRGKGAFGTVYRVKIAKGHFFFRNLRSANSDPIDIACKDFQSSEDIELEVMQQILSCKQTCANIAEIYGSLEIGSAGYSIFMPLAIEDLRAHMKDDTRPRPSATKRTDIILGAAGVAGGLKFLHKGIDMPLGGKLVCYHMHLKLDNILIFLDKIDDNGKRKPHYIWKISDFGMSRIRYQDDNERRDAPSLAGTRNERLEGTYLAPESLLPSKSMKTASDVWSLGFIISVLFTYLAEGTDGLYHRTANGYDRFFVANTAFGRPKIHPEIRLCHDLLIKKANQQIPQEGQALKSILNYLEQDVLVLDQKNRDLAADLQKQLSKAHRAYRELDDTPRERPSGDHHQFRALLQDIRISGSMGSKKEASKRADTWFFKPKEGFKGCEISPDGSIIAFWNDFTISLYTQSFGRTEGENLHPVAEFSLRKTGEPRRFWKSLSLTSTYSVAILSGIDFPCFVFDLRRDIRRNKSRNISLEHSTHVSISLPEIKEVAISPGGQKMACIVRKKDKGDSPGSLYMGIVGSPNEWKLGLKLEWPASDVIQLSFSGENNIYIVFRPQRTDRSHKHKIPVLHACLTTKHMYPLIIEPQHCWRIEVCAIVTREKQLHIQSLTESDKATPAIQTSRSIKNYRVVKLVSGNNEFAYVGVEVVSSSGGGNSFKFSAIWIPVSATVAYCLSGVLGTLDIERKDPHLPRLSWLPPDPNRDDNSPSRAAFVVIALASKISGLADTFNTFLVFTCLSCATTNLYVASRTLFGLASRLEGGEGRRWYLRFLASFGTTDSRGFPLRAMIFSAIAFWWVPFLQLIRGTSSPRSSVNTFVEVLSEMASVSVLHVWACECLAFIRFYRCIYQHRNYLERENIALVQRWSVKNYSDYPYRGYGQPMLAYLALLGCVFVLLVANGAALWNGFHLLPFLASYLTVIFFIGTWILLKIFRSAPWSFVDLSQPKKVADIFKHLHAIRFGVTDSNEDISER